jgi:hypothetical protein
MQAQSQQFEQGQTVYDGEGHEYTYATTVPGHGHVVSARFDTFDGAGNEVTHEGPDIIHHGPLHAEPPIGRRAQQIATLDEQLASRRKELADLNSQLSAAKIDHGALLDRLKQHQVLQRIDDVLAGRVTHVVSVEYGVVGIRAADDLSDTGWNGKARLLSLFGNAMGDLEYRLNSYSDGSGSSHEAWPCFSLEEATAKAVEMVEQMLANYLNQEKTPTARALESFIGYLEKFGAPVPTSAREALHKAAIAEAEKQVVEACARLDRAESALSAAKEAAQ